MKYTNIYEYARDKLAVKLHITTSPFLKKIIKLLYLNVFQTNDFNVLKC